MYGSAPIVVLLLQRADKSADVCYSPGGLQPAAMSKRRCSVFHEDTIEKLLDRVSYMREELIAIERSLERMQIAKLTQNGDKRGPTHFPNSKAETSNSRTVRVVS